MIRGNERLVMIVGMAHSGTTILTYVLKQHPDVVCFQDGAEAWLLENTLLRYEKSEPIQLLLNKFPNKKILLKAPWNCVRHSDWMEREIPDAKFLYCLRPFEEISKSWSKPASFVNEQLRSGGEEYQHNSYQMYIKRAMDFRTRVPHFRIVSHKDLLTDPEGLIAEIAAWVGLAPWEFNVSEVSATKNIKDLMGQKARMTYSHSGDFGDTIAAMALVRELGGGELILYPTKTRERMTPARAEVIAPLLERQHYVVGVHYGDEPAPVGTNLDHGRHNFHSGLNLCDMYFSWIGRPHLDRDQPWLWAEPSYVAEVVFARSPRYHGDFPWKQAVKKYAGMSVFLGLPEEHRAFVREFGSIPYYPTKDLWEVACILAAAKLVLVNQTCIYWIAEALKRPVCLEASSQGDLRNCHWGRTAFIYGENQQMELPDVDLLDERLAYVCRERDLGRSLLDGSRRLSLARTALSCQQFPGDAAEMGVFQGGSAAVIAAALPGKTVHLHDTFTGCPADDVFTQGHRKGDFGTDLVDVKKFLAGYKVEFHPGFFPDTAVDARYCFVHVDGDLYQTTKDALKFYWKRLVPGGAIVFDDLGWKACPGVQRALEEAGLMSHVEQKENQGILRKSA